MKKESKVNRKVYMFDEAMNLLKEFNTTRECADYFNKDVQYINYNLCHYNKIRKYDKWYIIQRDEEDPKDKEIRKLNNIINKLEKWLNEVSYFAGVKQFEIDIDEVLDKLKELKEDKHA